MNNWGPTGASQLPDKEIFKKPTDTNTYSSIVSAECNPKGSPSNLIKANLEAECNPKGPPSNLVNGFKKNNKGGKKKCYTCKPRGKVLKHIIDGTGCKDFVFHFDLHKRPIILITPSKHYENIYQIPHADIIEMLRSIEIFCDFWKIKDYQVSYNNGNWQTHTHFHIKIKANEKIINRLRRDHFQMKKLNNNYTAI